MSQYESIDREKARALRKKGMTEGQSVAAVMKARQRGLDDAAEAGLRDGRTRTENSAYAHDEVEDEVEDTPTRKVLKAPVDVEGVVKSGELKPQSRADLDALAAEEMRRADAREVTRQAALATKKKR